MLHGVFVLVKTPRYNSDVMRQAAGGQERTDGVDSLEVLQDL